MLNLLAACVLDGGVRKTCDGAISGAKHVFMASAFQAAQQMGYTLAYVFTDPATALLLTSLNPLWAALLGWRLLDDALPWRTVAALCGAGASIAVVFLPPLLITPGAGAATNGTHSVGTYTPEALVGDATALLTGASVASYIITVRHAASACPRASMSGAAGLGALVASAVSFAVAGSSAVDQITAGFLALALLAACGLALGYVMLSIAPRLVTGAEVALAMQCAHVRLELCTRVATSE